MTPEDRATQEATGLEGLHEQAEQFKVAILAIVDAEPERWWRADELRDAANAHGAMAMYALSRLCNPEYGGPLELDPHLRIRRSPGHDR